MYPGVETSTATEAIELNDLVDHVAESPAAEVPPVVQVVGERTEASKSTNPVECPTKHRKKMVKKPRNKPRLLQVIVFFLNGI